MTDRSRNMVLWWATSWLTVLAARFEPSYATPLGAVCALAVARAAWLTLSAAGAFVQRLRLRWRALAAQRRAAREGEAALLTALAGLLPADLEARPAGRGARRVELRRGGEVVATLRPVALAAWSRESALFGAPRRRRARTAARAEVAEVLVPAKGAYAASELRLYLDEALAAERPSAG